MCVPSMGPTEGNVLYCAHTLQDSCSKPLPSNQKANSEEQRDTMPLHKFNLNSLNFKKLSLNSESNHY